MNLIRTIHPITWLAVGKALLACALILLFLFDDARQLALVVGIVFGLVAICFGLACYSRRAARPRPVTGGPADLK